MPYSHLATATTVLWKLLEASGHDPEPVYREAGIDPATLKTPGGRIRYRSVRRIWETAAAIIDDPCFGLQAPRFWHPSYLHALGYAWLASHSLRDALGRLVRYLHILSEAGGISLLPAGDTFTLGVDMTSAGMWVPAQVDATMAVILHMCRLNFGERLEPLAVHFCHPAPSCSQVYRDFFRSTVEFEADSDRMIFRRSDVDQHLPGSNPHIARANDQVMISYLASLPRTDIVHRTKAGIIDMLPSGDVTDEKVARELGLSTRSLQRRLGESGTTFRTLLDEIRKDLAMNYLRDADIELSEIAFLLGFSEQSAFSRAFKRMTGRPPREVRAAG